MVQDLTSLTVAATPRALTGSPRVKRLRAAGWLPGIVYDAQGRSQPIQLQRHAFEMLLRRRAGENLILDLALEGQAPRKVLLKAVQRDPVRDCLMHIDFLEISLTRKLRVPVSIRLSGEPVGVSQQGGVLEHLLRTVEVECLPMDIVREFVMDVSGLSIGDTAFVRDLKVDAAKLTVLTAPDIAVAAVLMPHVEEEAKPEEAPGEEAAPEAAGAAKEGEAAEGADAKDKGKEAKDKGKEAEAKPDKAKDARGKGKE